MPPSPSLRVEYFLNIASDANGYRKPTITLDFRVLLYINGHLLHVTVRISNDSDDMFNGRRQ
ncbi:MAG: hypothetical protein ACE1Z6_05890 [Candidatus Methylomirabilales bacterium]|nr:hypothetical protein [candidate division NC10 bacterium]